MKEQVVLVDFENVQKLDLAQLPSHARIKVFTGQLQSKVSMTLAKQAQPLGSRLQYVTIEGNGRNALDFHIACHLGEGICKSPKAEFVILSNDKGFDPLVQHLKARGFQCRRDGQARPSPAAKPQLSAHAQAVVERLRQIEKNKRPRKREKLFNHLETHFKTKLTAGEIKKAVEHLLEAGLIVGTEAAVTYNF